MPTIVFQGDATGVRRATSQATQDVKRLGSTVSSAMGALGVTVGAAGMVAGVRALVNELDGIGEAAQRVGVSAQEMQVLGHAAKLSGIEVGEFEAAYRKMNDTIGSAMVGNQAAGDALARLGMTAGDFAGKDMAERFRMIATGLLAIGDESERAAVAQDVLGKSAARLLPALQGLNEVRARMQEGGLLFSDAQIEAADKFSDTMTELSVRLKALVVDSGLVGWLSDVAEGLGKVAQGAAQIESPAEEGGWIKKLLQFAGAAEGEQLAKLFDAMGDPWTARALRDKADALMADAMGGQTIKTGAPDVFGERGRKRDADARAQAGAETRAAEASAAADKAAAVAAKAEAKKQSEAEKAATDLQNDLDRLDTLAAEAEQKRQQAAGEAMRALKDVSPEAVVEAAADMAATNVPTRWSSSTFGGALTRVGGDAGRVMDFAQASLDTRRNELLQQIAKNTEPGAVFP